MGRPAIPVRHGIFPRPEPGKYLGPDRQSDQQSHHDEATSARVALQLGRAGVKNVKVLLGGWDAWIKAGGKVETGPEQ